MNKENRRRTLNIHYIFKIAKFFIVWGVLDIKKITLSKLISVLWTEAFT